ncbi:NlpC/P60 family protein [Schaalia sp. Marseille-Q2122]|uniref:NlpC/P60 family protein n=1 Tax=Schaalia sp. Marseille-Q2122 TaxID=2736604 RepID=UPI0034C622B8
MISFRHKGTNHYHHIGIYAGIDSSGQRLMLHAPTFGDVVSIVPLDTRYWQSMDWATFRI